MDYKLETLNDDLKEIIASAKELKKLKATIKEEKKAFGHASGISSQRLIILLATIGERATGISQVGMNEDDESIKAIAEEILA